MKYENGIFIETLPVISDAVDIYKELVAIGVQNLIPLYKLHTTVCYSSAAPSADMVPLFEPCRFNSVVTGVEVWNDETLVLTLDSKNLQEKHKEYMDKFNLSYDYDSYKPHMSLVYNIESYSKSMLDMLNGKFKGKSISFYGCWFKEIMKNGQ